MIKILLVPAAAVALAVVGAAPALAHEEIRPNTIQTGKPAFFTLFAANEKQADLTKVVVTAPAGTKLGETTQSPAGWAATTTDSSVTWTGGKAAPNTFEQWGFEIDGADQPGTLNFKVTMTAGDSEDVTVPVTVVAAGGATGPTSTVTTTTGSSVSAAPTTPPATAAIGQVVEKSSSKANTAFILAIIASVIGLIDLVLIVTT